MTENTLMFGKSQKNIGSTDAHACINTAGDVYIKTKNRYVCIFKGGKLNVDDSPEIFSVDSVDSIKKTGVYLVSETNESGETTQSAYLCIDGVKLLLASGSEQYVSFSAVQSLTPENFLQAAKNIGLYFDSLDDAKASKVQNGLIYILSEQRLYKVVNGDFSEYIQVGGSSPGSGPDPEDPESPEPGQGEYDSLQIGNIFIDGTEGIINAEGSLIIQVNGSDYFKLKGNVIYPLKDIQLNLNRELSFQDSQKGQSGFSLWYENGEAFLDVDHLTTRDAFSNSIPQRYSPYIGTAVAGYINMATRNETTGDIQLNFLSDMDLKVGDVLLLYIGSKNQVVITTSQPTEEEEGYGVVLQTENPVETETVVRVVGGDSEPYVTVDLTIPAGESIAGDTVTEDISPIQRIELISGDSNLYFINNMDEISGISASSQPAYGTVTSVNPVEVHLSTAASESDSILSAFKYTPVYRIAQEGKTETVLWHEAENISLVETALSGDSVSKKVISKIGNLSDIISPVGTALANWGIYSDNFWAVKAHLFASVFEGDSEEWYPKYGVGLPIPNKYESDSEEYDLVVPPIQWVKLIVEKKVEETLESLIDDAKTELKEYIDTKISQMEASILAEVDERIAAAMS